MVRQFLFLAEGTEKLRKFYGITGFFMIKYKKETNEPGKTQDNSPVLSETGQKIQRSGSMVIFSTMFYVKKELTKEKMAELAFEWVNKSQHYGFGNLVWNGEDFYERECEKQKFSLIVSNDNRTMAIRLENRDGDILWTSDFTFTESDGRNLLFVRLNRDAMDKESIVPHRFHRPRLMKEILRAGYGAEDNRLLISDKEVLITRENINLAEDVICGRTKYLLPVVYVTKRFMDSTTILDTEELAKDLAGTAHVLVEESTDITTELKKRTGGENPFNGAVHIYYTDKVGNRIIPEAFSKSNTFRNDIVDAVCRRLSQVKVEDKYTWETIKYQKLLEKSQQYKEENAEMAEVFEEILKSMEEIVKSKEDKCGQLEAEANELRGKVEYYEHALQNRKGGQTGDIVFSCSETEFFEGEIKDMILELLEREKKQMDDDPNQVGWRIYHVLKAILAENEITGKGKILETDLKDILSRVGRLNAKDKRRLQELGFISKDRKHNKLYFHGDGRYMITLGKTPGDGRASANAASEAVKTIVCRIQKV